MTTPVVRLSWAMLAAASLCLQLAAAQAQTEPVLRVHAALEGEQRPHLCKSRDSVNLLVPILSLAFEARASGEREKSARLTDIATRLQNEICFRPAAEDIVILRCKLAQRDFAGGKISTLKLSAVVRAEASKGEQPFFGWTFANIDESGNGTAEGRTASTRWCTGDQVAEEQLTLTPDIVVQVQQRLYDFGLRIPQINGQISNDTVQSLVQFQKWANLPANGQLNKPTLEKITTTPAPSPWVSFAFDGYGNFGAQTAATRRGAELQAIGSLQRRSRRDFKLSSVPNPSCIALALTRYSERGRRARTNFTQAFTSAGDSIEVASKNAWDFCEREKGGGNCDIRYALCADGSDSRGAQAKRFDPGSIPANAPGPRFDPGSMPLNSRFDPNDLPKNAPAPPRFNPKDPPENARPPTLRFDPNNPSTNAQVPERRSDPRNAPAPALRFDSDSIPANAPPPKAR